MKILGILGSSRRGGNTEVLLDIALKEAEAKGIEVSKIPLGSKSIAPCNGCLKCMTTGECVIEDDMQEIYQGMLEADGILWSTPVYFWGMTGQTKTVIDRTYALSFPELKLANKVGGLIVVAASRGCMSTANLFHMYFRYNSMFFAETVSGYASQKGERIFLRSKSLFCLHLRRVFTEQRPRLQKLPAIPHEFQRLVASLGIADTYIMPRHSPHARIF